MFTPIPRLGPEVIEAAWKSFLATLRLRKISWEKHTEEGSTAEAIIHQTESIKADLIVMGTHGRSELEHMLMGSVAEKVPRKASCPVLTVRPEALRLKLP